MALDEGDDTGPVDAVDVVLPCLDEAEALPWLLSRMPSWARPIVVDNGSTDGSARIARDHGALVVPAGRRGYGAACHAGLQAAGSEVVAFMDADASLDPADLALLLRRRNDGPHLLLGRRVAVGRGAWPWHLRLANRALTRLLRRRTGLSLNDIGPMRMAPRAALLALPIHDRRSGYPLETVLRAAQAGWQVTEVDTPYRPRAGRSKVTGTPLGAARTVRDMTRVLRS
jgi:glycosyltransferase involved in cell wall biosynthesis